MVMLGLLQCSVPPVLKAELLHCLAAFGKSPEIAASLWQSLEYTQVRLINIIPISKFLRIRSVYVSSFCQYRGEEAYINFKF